MSSRKQHQTQHNSTKRRTSPFSVHIFADHSDSDGQPASLDGPQSLLPASYRGQHFDVVAARQDITACIAQELDLHRLSDVHEHLWLAGLPLPPRALHHQLLLGREVVITERMDMHLVWAAGRMFLKPLPRFLLELTFWSEYLDCEDRCGGACPKTVGAMMDETQLHPCDRQTIRRRALGFLYSYAALIAHESDFRIAQEKYLLPPEIRWSSWRTLVEQLLDVEHLHSHIDQRFFYGELRLSRLNKIYSFYKTPLRGYLPNWDRYGAFFEHYFALLASTVAYMALVLTAMQVGLATEWLAHYDAFQSACYGFTVFSILGPLAIASLIFLYVFIMFFFNGVKALRRNKDRLSKLNGV